MAPPTDPHLPFDTRDELNDFHILDPGELEQAAGLMLGKGTHEQIHAAMQPAVERFKDFDEEDQDMFRDAFTRFVRVYGFLAQIVRLANVDLERDYIYCRALAMLIREKNAGWGIDLGSEVELSHLRHEKASKVLNRCRVVREKSSRSTPAPDRWPIPKKSTCPRSSPASTNASAPIGPKRTNSSSKPPPKPRQERGDPEPGR